VSQTTLVFVLDDIVCVLLLYLASVLDSVGVPLVPLEPEVPELPLVPLDPLVPLLPLVPDVPLTGSITTPLKVNTLASVGDKANNIGFETSP